MQIEALDHFVLLCPDIEAGTKAYETLLGRAPDWRASAGGAATVLFRVENTALELMAPDGDDGAAPRLRELTADGPALTSLAFRAANIDTAHHTLARRGLGPDAIRPGESTDLLSGKTRRWQRFRCSDDAMAGIKTFILQLEGGFSPVPVDKSSVHTLDHIVINTPNPDRAAANYGARLGLDLRLDRAAPEWKTRFLFFRLGGLTLEIINRMDEASDPQSNDRIWGLTWTVGDIDGARARLTGDGLDCSDIRTGRKPGTRVFTVKSGTLGVPTLFITHDRD